MSNKKADSILDRDLKKAGYNEDKSKSGVYYKGSDQINADKLSYSHSNNSSAVYQHTNGKKIK